MVNVGVVGCGRWGVNYVRVFEELPQARVESVCDRDEEALGKITRRFPGVKACADIDGIAGSPDIDVVVVATPATGHYDVVTRCLEAGKHVLVEKPIATTVEEAAGMMRSAASAKRVLMVGHTFLFNPGVRAVKRWMDDDLFGDLYYLHATRTNMGPIRKDVNAVWDLATHDVSIFNYLLDSLPLWVSATGSRLLRSAREDVAFVTLGYGGNVIANIHVSWADPFKVREVVAVGSRRRVVFDDIEGLERVKIFDKGVVTEPKADNFGEFRLLMRDGDIISPKIENTEPLKEQCLHFIECVLKGRTPVSDGRTGLDVVRVMTAIDESLSLDGAPVEVERPAGTALSGRGAAYRGRQKDRSRRIRP